MKASDLIDERTRSMLDDYVRNERQIAEMLRTATAMHKTFALAQMRLPSVEATSAKLADQLAAIGTAGSAANMIKTPVIADVLRGELPTFAQQARALTTINELSSALVADVTAGALKGFTANLGPDFSKLAESFFTDAVRFTTAVADDQAIPASPAEPSSDPLTRALVVMFILMAVTASLLAAGRPGGREQLEASAELLNSIRRYLLDHPQFALGGFVGATATLEVRRQKRR